MFTIRLWHLVIVRFILKLVIVYGYVIKLAGFFFLTGKQFIVKEGKIYTCLGTISNKGQCDGKLETFTRKNNSDYCFYKDNFSVVNDKVCIGATSVQVINNEVSCKNSFNEPVLVMKRDEFQNMCKELSQSVEYKYIADVNNPFHVKIPNHNKYVSCSNNEPNVCIFSESSNLFGSNVMIQNNVGTTFGNTFYSHVDAHSFSVPQGHQVFQQHLIPDGNNIILGNNGNYRRSQFVGNYY